LAPALLPAGHAGALVALFALVASLRTRLADDLHHALHVALTGETSGWYEGFTDLSSVAKALETGWVFTGQYSSHMDRRHGRDPAGLGGERFVVCSQNHDQVGNRPFGDRLAALVGPDLDAVASVLVACSPFLPLLFPDGRLPSPRWWPVAWLAVVDIVVLLVAVGFTSPGLFGGEPSPLAIIPAGPASEAIGTLAAILTLGAGVLCAGSLLVRYRRVDSDERQQLKWVAGAMAVFAVSLVVSVLLPPIDTFAWVLPIVPISVGIAILRYRLYDIDILIGRALAYVALSALLAGGYAASVALFQRLFILVTGDRSDAAIVITTLILASIFTPARKALEGVVERRFRPPEAVAAPAPEAVLVALDDPQLERRIDAIARAAVRDALRDRS